MGFVFLACLIWWPLMIGLGVPLVRALSTAGEPEYSPVMRLTLCALTGMLVMVFLGDVTNFFVPVYPTIPCLAAAAGITLLALNWKWAWRGIRWIDLAAAAVVLAAASLFAMQKLEHVDTGLYHLQAVRWITDSRLVPGLSNLHLRLGYNSAWAMVAAVTEGPGLLGRSTFVLNTLLAAMTGLLVLDAAKRVLTRGVTAADGLLALLPYPLVDMAIGKGTIPFWASAVPSLGNDMAAMVLVVIVLSLLAREPEKDTKADATVGLHALTLAVLAIVVKMSTAPLLAAAALIATWRAARARAGRPFAFGVLIWTLALGAWMARGIGLSGCPLYPLGFGRIPTAWTVSAQDAARDLAWIRSWARDTSKKPAEVLADWSWVGPWTKTAFKELVGAYVVAWTAAIGVTLIVFGLLRRRWSAVPGRAWACLATAAVGVAYWFAMAPHPRFGYGFIVGFCALAVLAGAQAAGLPMKSWAARGTVIAAAFWALALGRPSIAKHVPREDLFRIPRVPEAAVTRVETPDGAGVYVPTEGRLAWRAPLPSSWNVAPTLRMDRDPSTGRITMFRKAREYVPSP